MQRDLIILQAGRRMLKVHVPSLGDVAPRLKAMIDLVGLTGLLVPIGCPDTSGAGFLEGIVEASDSAEEVDECRFKRWHARIGA